MSISATEYGVLIQQISTESDPHQRAQLAARLANRLEAAFTASVNTAQVVRWETEEWLRQRVGETNDLVSQLNANQEAAKHELANSFDGLHQALTSFRTAQEAALDRARAEFHSGLNAVGESVSELRGDVKGMRVELTEVSNDVGVLREEAKRQAAWLSHLEAGQAAAVGQQNLQAQQIRDLTRQIEEMRQEADKRPSREETATLIERINTNHARLDALEAARRRSEEL